jgi:hypothetical protein
MNPELTPEPTPTEKQELPFPASSWERWLHAALLVGLPLLAFWGAAVVLEPEWQSGRLSDYVALMLSPLASLLFFLLLAYAIGAYIFLIMDPARYADSVLVRLGVYSGVPLALQYCVLAALTDINASFTILLPALLVLLALIKFYPWAVAVWGRRSVNIAYGIFFGGVYLIVSILSRSPLTALMFALIAVVVGSPFWCFYIYLRAAAWLLFHEKKLTLPHVIGMGAWVALYTAAWRFDLLKTMQLYAALPPLPPDCYIATAAAQGHPRVVRSRPLRLANGASMRVNAQLQRLKCFELSLLVAAPRLHSALRAVYDFLGPKLARRMRNPFAADLAYLALAPIEWTSTAVLRRLLPEFDAAADTMYIGKQK